MPTKQSVQNFGNALQQALASLIYNQQRGMAQSALSAPQGDMAGPVNPSNEDILRYIIQSNPQMFGNPFVQRDYQAAQAMAPRFEQIDPTRATVQRGFAGRVEQVIPPQPKPGEPFTLNPGDTRFGADGQQIATGGPPQPKFETVTIDDGGVPMQYRISYDPVSGKETGRQEIGPAFRQEPAALQDKNRMWGALDDTLNMIDNLYKNEYVGGFASAIAGNSSLRGATSDIRSLFGATDDRENQFRNHVKALADDLLRLKSGAQINEQEYARMLQFLPNVDLTPGQFKSAMTAFRHRLNALRASKQVRPVSPRSGGQAVDDPLGIL